VADLHTIAIDIVCANQPCPPTLLISTLQQAYGVGTADANRTLFELIHSGEVKRTAWGELRVPGCADAPGRHGYPAALRVLGIVFMLAIIAFMAVGFYILLTGGLLKNGFGPP
jgi:hypothetical protein